MMSFHVVMMGAYLTSGFHQGQGVSCEPVVLFQK